MGGTKNQDLVGLSKQIWNYLLSKQINECGGRCEGLKRMLEGLKRMDVEQGNLPKVLLKPRQTRDRSLCIESVETTQTINILENRPIQN